MTTLLLAPCHAFAFSPPLLAKNLHVTMKASSDWAQPMSEQAMSGLRLQYPHKVDHLWLQADGPLKSPKALHPVFCGNYDWHSAVHSHWCLLRILRRHSDRVDSLKISSGLLESITAEGCNKEAEYFDREGSSTFERPYGWGWLLKLAGESARAPTREGQGKTIKTIHDALRPLTEKIRSLLLGYLPKLKFPVRSGVHSQTAFALILCLDYAREVGDVDLEQAIRSTCMRIFWADENYNSDFEPSAEDFLSPGLCEMDIMRRLLSNEEFVQWATRFLPSLMDASRDCSILRPPVVADRDDARLCHLDGLLLSKAWNLRGIALSCERANTVEHEVILRMRKSADEHIQLAEWLSPNYVGSHWLHSFALLAFDDVS